jgi:hypothetical protein
MIKNILTAFILIASFANAIYGQRDKNLGSEQVEILGEFNPIISDAQKISTNPVITDTTKKILVSRYSLLDKKIKTTFEVDPIPSAKMKAEPLTKLHRAYLKGGYGNYNTPLGEFYLNSLRSKDFSYVIYARHLSSTGSLPDAYFPGFSDNNAGISGKYFLTNHTLTGGFDYTRNVVHYYGMPLGQIMPQPIDMDRSLIRQRFNNFTASTGLESNYKDTARINHRINLGFNNTTDLYDTAQENNVKLNARLSRFFRTELFSANAGVDFYNNTISDTSFFATIINVTPEVIHESKKWRLRIGGALFMQTGTDEAGTVHFFPVADLNFNLIDNFLIPYIGVDGKVERNSYRLLTGMNPFLSAHAPLRNSNTKYNLFGGFRGTLSNRVTFNTSLSYSNVIDMMFFVNQAEPRFPNRFTVVYDDVRLWNVKAEMAYQKSEKLKFLLKGEWFRYEMSNELHPWHRPELEVTFTSFYSLRDKIIIKGDIFYVGTRMARGLFYSSFEEGIVSAPTAERLRPFLDVNLGIEYRYTRRLSAFVNFNNIGAVRYNQWYNYPIQRFNAIGGITFSF